LYGGFGIGVEGMFIALFLCQLSRSCEDQRVGQCLELGTIEYFNNIIKKIINVGKAK
jgi:hypothetical protein